MFETFELNNSPHYLQIDIRTEMHNSQGSKDFISVLDTGRRPLTLSATRKYKNGNINKIST